MFRVLFVYVLIQGSCLKVFSRTLIVHIWNNGVVKGGGQQVSFIVRESWRVRGLAGRCGCLLLCNWLSRTNCVVSYVLIISIKLTYEVIEVIIMSTIVDLLY